MTAPVTRRAALAAPVALAATAPRAAAAPAEPLKFCLNTSTIRLPEGPLTGIFIGLDPTGRLELETGSGRRIIDAGDLFFGPPT